MRRLLTAAAACLLGLLALAPSAWGLADSIVGGKTRLALDPALFRLLSKEGVRVAPQRPGKLSGRVATLPVSSGQIDPAGASGTLTQEGGIRFAAGGTVVPLDHFGISTANQQVSARIDGRRVKLALVDGFTFSRRGFGNAYRIETLRLTPRAAGLLNRKLGLTGVFKAGRGSFGSIEGTTLPERTRVESGSIELAGAEGFFEKLKLIEAGLVGFETTPLSQTPPTYRFPLITGELTLDMRGGFAGAEAGWEIFADPNGPGAVMTLSNMTMNFEMPPVRPLAEMGRLTAQMQIHDAAGNPRSLGTVTLGTLILPTGTQRVDPASRTMTLAATPVKIGNAFVDRLNEVLAGPKGKPTLFTYEEPLGSVGVSLTAH
jgi:hypothetical protein